MKVIVVMLLVVVIVVVSIVVYVTSRNADITNYPPKNSKIVAFGDSLIFGYGATKGNDFISLLSKRLDRVIINKGVSGDTTADGLLRIDGVLKEDPGVVILLLGGNDYLRHVDEATTRSNLSTLIEKFESRGAVVVLLGVRGGILRDGRGALFAELSKKYHTVYMEDVLDGIFLKPELMFDGIHPNDAGYAIIADRLYDIFTRYKL